MAYINLDHLSMDDINKFAVQYYTKEYKVSNLLADWDISPSVISSVPLLIPPVSLDVECPYCHEKIKLHAPSKTDFFSLKYNALMDKYAYCNKCDHHISNCTCDNCVSKQKAVLVKKIHEQYQFPDKDDGINFHKLRVFPRIFIGTLLRYASDEDITHILPYDTAFNSRNAAFPSLYPNSDQEYDIYYRKFPDLNYLIVSPLSDVNSFKLMDNGSVTYYPYKVEYIPLINEFLNQDINSILSQPFYTSEDCDDILDFWKDLIFYECLEYFINQIKSAGFRFSPGKKTDQMFRMLIEKYPQSKIYNVIYRCIAYAMKGYADGRFHSRIHAANSILSSIERQFTRAVQEHWQLNDGYRSLPQSAVSTFFFQYVLPIAGKEFTTIPNMEIVKSFLK